MIYFLRTSSEAVKIGFTTESNFRNRLRAMQTSNHEELVCIRFIIGDKGDEQWLHRQFEDCHIRGEWFRFHPLMLTITPPMVDLMAGLEELGYSPVNITKDHIAIAHIKKNKYSHNYQPPQRKVV